MNTVWRLPPSALLEDDTALVCAVEAIYAAIYAQTFQDDVAANHALPVETRAVRRIGDWRVFLLLTPWMLARLLVPGTVPDLVLPAQWHAGQREGAASVVLGPLFEFSLLSTPQKAHLNYHTRIGHYLIQPLMLAMERYRDAGEVFAAWNDVIRIRDENMRRAARDCPLQQEVSRREFFKGILTRKA